MLQDHQWGCSCHLSYQWWQWQIRFNNYIIDAWHSRCCWEQQWHNGWYHKCDNVGGHHKWSRTDSKRMRLGAAQTACNAGCNKTVPRGTSERRKQDGLIAWLSMHTSTWVGTILVGKEANACTTLVRTLQWNHPHPICSECKLHQSNCLARDLHLQSLPLSRPLLLDCSYSAACCSNALSNKHDEQSWVFIMPIPR